MPAHVRLARGTTRLPDSGGRYQLRRTVLGNPGPIKRMSCHTFSAAGPLPTWRWPTTQPLHCPPPDCTRYTSEASEGVLVLSCNLSTKQPHNSSLGVLARCDQEQWVVRCTAPLPVSFSIQCDRVFGSCHTQLVSKQMTRQQMFLPCSTVSADARCHPVPLLLLCTTCTQGHYHQSV